MNNKKIIRYLIVVMLGLMPLTMHYYFDVFNDIQIKYINYCSDIFSLNSFIYMYGFINYYNKRNPFNYFVSILYIGSFLSFIISFLVYIGSFNVQLNLNSKGIFLSLVVLVILNFIFTLVIEISFFRIDAVRHSLENRYEYYSENRYETYLLKRIEEKLNSIKNNKSEEDNDTKKSGELLDGSDILAEMLRNHIEIKEYFRISKNQSKFSFYFSIVSSVVGIIVVIIAASGIVIFKSLGISIIAAVSGAITEIISGIVLWIHNKSALQLNYYYDSLHENEKFLSALNIADKLSEEKKEEMYIEIIRKQIDIQSKDEENKVSDNDKQ